MKSTKEIKDIFQAACVDELPELIQEYNADDRSSVQKMLESARKKIAALEKEKHRFWLLQ